MKGGNSEPNRESRPAQLSMDSKTNLCRFVVTDDKPTWAIGLVQNGYGETYVEETLLRLDATFRDPGCTPK